ncbi:MAG: tocopherol cyclase family protein [Myxococcota bacterium]
MLRPMDMDTANALRWHPGDTGHVESHFLKANSPDGRRAVWVKHTVFAPEAADREAVAEVWAIAFDRDGGERFPVGGKQSVPVDEARFDDRPFRIVAAGSELRSGEARGQVDREGHLLRWDLRYEPRQPPFRTYPSELMYRGRFPKLKSLTPCPDGIFSGSLEVDGERWEVDRWPGMQGHNWGRGHLDIYAWAHCNSWDGDVKDVWFEAGCGKLRMGPIMSPWLGVAALHIDGHTIRFDGPRGVLPRAVQVGFDRWRFRFEAPGHVLHGDIAADPSRMAGLYYRNPAGPTTHCLNSKLARATLRLERPGRPTTTLSTQKIALEIGTHDPDHGVRMVA